MAQAIAPNTPSIDALPADIRQQVIDKLIAGASSRAVSQWLSQRGHRVSFAAVNRYNQKCIKPALKIGAQIQQTQALERKQDTSLVESARAVADVTKQVLKAEPVLARTEWVWDELKGGVEETRADWVTDPADKKRREFRPADIKARASLLNVARGLIETEAKALMHPGFVAAAVTPVTQNNTIIVMPGRTAFEQVQPQAEVIDVEVIDASSE
jgi:hypothetical protein